MAVKKKEDSLTIEDKLKAALVPEDEQPYPIPENWVWTKTGTIADINMGQSPAGIYTNTASNGLPLVGGPVDMGDAYPVTERFTSKPTKTCKQGDIIISVRATIGRLNIADKEYCLGRGVAGMRGIEANQHFIKRFLETCTRALMERGTGTTFLQISKADIASLAFPLPPLPEQQRIAEKLESLFGKMKEAKALLDEIPEILQNFRQTVLAKAVSGALFVDNGMEEHNESTTGWSQYRFGDLYTTAQTGLDRRGAEQSRDRRYAYFKMNNISADGRALTDEMTRIDASPTEVARYFLSSGDFLFNTRNSVELVGKTCVFEATEGGAPVLYNNNILRVRFLEWIDPKYINFWFCSPIGRQAIEPLKSATTNVAAIYQSRLNELPIIVPPSETQTEIVRRVESLFSKADDLEAQYKEAMELIESLPEIILSKAFRGELVPQDPNDEPAFGLLERITFEKEKHETEKVEGTKRKKHKQNV